MRWLAIIALVPVLLLAAHAQETPYFVTYDHHLEEPGDLDIETQSTFGFQKHDRPTYWAPLIEFEYGVTNWWNASLYLEGASQLHDSTVFTGWRLENRFRPLSGDHALNPVLYFEFEDINEASRIQKEIVGHTEPSAEALSELRQEKDREVEFKLILSSDVKNWNISENFMVEKNLNGIEATEFGYAFAFSRPLSAKISGTKCRWCRERFNAGAELYGGLGSSEGFGFADTAHYVAPTIAWRIRDNSSLQFSPAFGVTSGSDRMLLRVGYKYEIEDFARKVSRLLQRP